MITKGEVIGPDNINAEMLVALEYWLDNITDLSKNLHNTGYLLQKYQYL